MAPPINQLSEKTRRELSEMLSDWRQSRAGRSGIVETDQSHAWRQVRWARTTTDSNNPVYPSNPSNKFVVEFGQYEFDNRTVGLETPVFTAYDPQETRVALSLIGHLVTGTEVYVSHHHGRWYILDDTLIGQLYVGNLAENMCTTDGNADVNTITNVDTGEVVANLTALNSFVLSGQTGDLVLLKWIRRFNDYVIVQVQHKLVAVLVDVYVSAGFLKGDYRDIAAMYCGAVRTENLETMTACP